MPRRGGNVTSRRATIFVPGARRRSNQSIAAEISLLVNTVRELAAIRTTAEEAAGCILSHAEDLLASSETEEAVKARDALLTIMTACGFHDLVGQRVAKITASLDEVIAARLKRSVRTGKKETPPRRKQIGSLRLDGPGLPGTSLDQDSIDALMAKA